MGNSSVGVKVSVILVNYNTSALALDCLRTLHTLRIPDLEVVLLDNGSREFDPTPFEAAWPRIVIRTIPDNRGYGGGANEAVKAASGEYLMLVNTDTTFPADNGMHELVRFLDENPTYAAAAPLVVDRHGDVDPWQAGYLPSIPRMVAAPLARLVAGRLPAARPLLGRIALNLAPLAERDTEVTTFATSLIRRSCFDAVGGFSPDYFLYLEDTDICRKLKLRGWRIRWMATTARVIHLEGGSSKDPEARERQYQRALGIYFRKWHGRSGLIGLRLIQLPFRLAPALERWRRGGPAMQRVVPSPERRDTDPPPLPPVMTAPAAGLSSDR